MLSSLRRIAPLFVLSGALASGFSPTQSPIDATGPCDATTPADSTVSMEVRALRKLHLVRPDLIPYPIAYEVVC